MNKLRLSIATGDYDHFRDIREGVVKAEGIELTWSRLTHHEVFARFTADREWDIAELSLAKFLAQVSQPESDIIALPIVASRRFRFGSIYLNTDANIKEPRDLRGKRVGIPEWAHSAAVWVRGWLEDEFEVSIEDIEWIQAGVNTPGRLEKVDLHLPGGVRYESRPEKTLSGMLLDGALDAAFIARPPAAFHTHPEKVVRLFPDYQAAEEAYYKRTSVWPVMHIMAIQKRVLQENPWVARNLYNAFLESKDRSLERLRESAVSRYPMAWGAEYFQRLTEIFGEDIYPYGIEANRATWQKVLDYGFRQGIMSRAMKPEDIFASTIETSVVV